MKKKNLFPGIFLALLMFLGISPFVFINPLIPDSATVYVGVALLVACLCFGIFASGFFGEQSRKNLTRVFMALSLATVGSFILLKLSGQGGNPYFFNSNFLATWQRLDGERAYDAAVFELYCIVWVILSSLFLLMLSLIRRKSARS